MLGCDVIGLQETRRPERIEFAAAGYRVFCRGVDGSSGRAGQHGVGLAVKESIIREATWTQELTNERLMSMTLNLTGSKFNAVTIVVAYGPTDTVSNTREQKDVFWADLESCCCCCFSHSAHWLPTRKKLLYTVANPACSLLDRKKKKKKVWQRLFPPPPPPPPPLRCSFGENKK